VLPRRLIIFCSITIIKRDRGVTEWKMEKKVKVLKIVTFVMIAIAAMYAFDSLNNGPLSGNSLTGMVVSQDDLSQQNVNCYDTDGHDYYVQGTTYAQVFQVNGEEPKKDVCEGNTLIEYYCMYNDAQVEFYDCPNGCFSGACAQ